MDKHDLISEAVTYKMEIISLGEFSTAVDRYTEAIIAKSQCSTLRAALVQILNKEKEGYKAEPFLSDAFKKHTKNIETIINTLKLIDELQQPVA